MSCSSRTFDLLTVFYPSPHDSSRHVSFYRMGTSAKNAGSQENFTKIDKEYVEPFFDHLDKLSSSPPFFFFYSFLTFSLGTS
jgi:hypothetical protein